MDDKIIEAIETGDLKELKLLFYSNQITNGHLRMVEYLIGKAVEIDGKYDFKLLRFASGNGYFKIVKYLVKRGVDINDNLFLIKPLHKACENGYFEIVKYLAEKGANVNEVYPNNPLCIASTKWTF